MVFEWPAECARLNEVQFMRNDLRAREAWKCGKGWQRSHKGVQKVSMNIEIICMLFCDLV
jgi:hypothetical protein